MSGIWHVAGASVAGVGHVQAGTCCQDAYAYRLAANGAWISLAASDGAGTAEKAAEGAQLVTEFFADRLISLASQLELSAPGAWVNDFVIEQILAARQRLREIAGGDDLRAFHCTLVCALVGPQGGFVAHIGDGVAMGGRSTPPATETSLNLADGFFVSQPDNGEYANETFFLTEGDWIRHLRLTPVPSCDWIVLGTDGAMALAMRGSRPNEGFVAPLIEAIRHEADERCRCEVIANILGDSRADRLTNDDKTLIVGFRDSLRQNDAALRVEFVWPDGPISATNGAPKTIPPASGLSNPSVSSPSQLLASNPSNHNNLQSAPSSKRRKLYWLVGILVLAVFSLLTAVAFSPLARIMHSLHDMLITSTQYSLGARVPASNGSVSTPTPGQNGSPTELSEGKSERHGAQRSSKSEATARSNIYARRDEDAKRAATDATASHSDLARPRSLMANPRTYTTTRDSQTPFPSSAPKIESRGASITLGHHDDAAGASVLALHVVFATCDVKGGLARNLEL